MRANYLNMLVRRYSSGEGGARPSADDIDPLGDLLQKYRDYRYSSLIDLAVIASQLSLERIVPDHLDRLVAKAIHATNPDFDPSTYHSPEEWTGILNAAKGKYFEYLVAEKLNAGQAVGDVVLPHGYHAELAASMTQPGWDLRIVDQAGRVHDLLQLKATESVGYIHHALNTYPDIKIVATDEVATRLGHTHMVLDSSITEDQLRIMVEHGADYAGSGVLDQFWQQFHPVVPLLVIVSMQGYQVLVGRRTIQHALEVGLARAHRALATTGVAAMVKLAGGGWLAIPAAVFVGIWVTERQTIDELVEAVRKQTKKLRLRSAHYASWDAK